ncbi:hypothetical protein BH10PSE10_BH10PSE10_07900 [soil metagenome]
MSKASALYRKYFPIYLVTKWMLIVLALSLLPKLIGAFS